MNNKSKFSDLIVAICVTIFGIIICISSMKLPSAKLGLGAGGFPSFIGTCFIVVGVAYTIVTLRQGVDFTNIRISLKAYKPTILTIAIATVYVSLLSTIGFLILTPILMFVTMLCFGYRQYIKAIILSVLFSTTVYILFTKVFLIFLPEGILYI